MFNKLSEKKIQRYLRTSVIGRNIVYMPVCNSTNNIAKSDNSIPHGALITADTQTAGKGRLGRSWESEKGDGIYMSILLKPENLPSDTAQITLIAAIAVCRALGGGAKIKWPNDIVISARKVCGILTELSTGKIICGIGVNVNNKCFDSTLCDKATSLFLENGKKFRRERIIADILNIFEPMYSEFLLHGFAPFAEEYRRLCINIGKDARVIYNNREIIGKVCNITDNGELVLESDAEKILIDSGEVSVRGIYGYA